MALRSLIETVACQHLIYRRQYLKDAALLREVYQASDRLAAKLQAMRRTILGERRIAEATEEYQVDLQTPFDESDDDRR
jgi:hypothetical protein